jgi:hypothetical protein
MLAILVVTVYLAGLRKSAASTVEQAKPHGRYNYQQILAHTKLPAFELFGDAANLQMTAYSVMVVDGDGRSKHVWNVVCTDSTGKDLGFFGWNSDNGDLINYSDRALVSNARPEGPVTAVQAVGEARNWLRELTINRQTRAWKLVGRPARRLNVWLVQFAGPTGAADLRIDIKSGKLLSYHLVNA